MILVDTGFDHTIVLVSRKLLSKENQFSVVPVLCVHGDMLPYPSACVELQSESRQEMCHVVVAPSFSVLRQSWALMFNAFRKEGWFGLWWSGHSQS